MQEADSTGHGIKDPRQSLKHRNQLSSKEALLKLVPLQESSCAVLNNCDLPLQHSMSQRADSRHSSENPWVLSLKSGSLPPHWRDGNFVAGVYSKDPDLRTGGGLQRKGESSKGLGTELCSRNVYMDQVFLLGVAIESRTTFLLGQWLSAATGKAREGGFRQCKAEINILSQCHAQHSRSTVDIPERA